MNIRRLLAMGAVAVLVTLLTAACANLEWSADESADAVDAVDAVDAKPDVVAPPDPASSPVTAEPSKPVEPPAARTTSVVMGGDLLWHNTVWHSAAEDHRSTGRGAEYDWDPMFAALKPTIESADLAICHSEVPFAAPGAATESYPVFAAPRSIAPWIASMGWDACTTASNHSWDKGFDGVSTTADLFEANQIPHVGTARSEAERGRPVIVTTAAGVRVGVVAATYGLNGFVTPEEQWWAVSQTTEARDSLLDQAAAARAAGADIVIAHVHWGTEYDHLPHAEQIALAEVLTASPDVDLVLGEHAHVVQPITKVHGKWVVYGLGNMVAQNEVSRPNTYEGITIDFEFTEQPDGGWRVSRAAYVPTQWNHYTPGNPIRITDADGSHLASVRSAVNAIGGNRGLVEDRLAP